MSSICCCRKKREEKLGKHTEIRGKSIENIEKKEICSNIDTL